MGMEDHLMVRVEERQVGRDMEDNKMVLVLEGMGCINRLNLLVMEAEEEEEDWLRCQCSVKVKVVPVGIHLELLFRIIEGD